MPTKSASSSFGTRAKEARERAGLSVSDVASHFNLSVQSVYGWENGSMPKGDRVTELARLYDTSVQWLAYGEGALRTLQAEDGSFSVPMLDVEVSAGGGSFVDSVSIVKLMELDPDWVREHLPSVSKGSLVVFSVHGDSMEPTFYDSDIILVDTSVTRVRREGFYVCSFDDMLYAKRIQPFPGHKLVIISDNKAYKDIEINLEDESIVLQIHGRIVYSWTGTRR